MASEKTRDPVQWLLGAFLASLPLIRPSAFKVGSSPVALADLLLPLVYLAWLVQTIRKRRPLRLDGLLIATLVYIGVLAVSALRGSEPLKTSLLKLAAYSMYLLLPSLVIRIVDSAEDLRRMLRAWLAGATLAVLASAFGIVAWYVDREGVGRSFACPTYGLLPSGNFPRLCSSFVNPNMHCNYLVVSVALGLAYGASELRRIHVVFLAGIATIVAMFTLSAGFGGYLLMIAIVYWGASRQRHEPVGLRHFAAAATAVGGAIFFTITMISVMVPRGEGHLSIGSRAVKLFDGSRWAIWSSSIDTIKRHPIIGKGYSSYVAWSDDPKVFLSPDQIASGRGPASAQLEAHNIWLNVAGQSGLIGLAAFGFVLYQIVRGLGPLARTSFRSKLPLLPLLPVALIAALVGGVAFHGLFGALEEGRHVWALFAVCAAAVHCLRAQEVEDVPTVQSNSKGTA
ncbi:MAG: O-antigen ligase family protein [Polyangiaceae bacterium]|nr:O-antigen ligase family protein [Polyangiaceae bacterium]